MPSAETQQLPYNAPTRLPQAQKTLVQPFKSWPKAIGNRLERKPRHTNLWVSSDSGKAPSLWNKATSMARNDRKPYAFFMANFAL